MSMSLSSVWGVWMCVFLYIQNSEAAIRGFLPKNTDVEKTERAQENLWFNTPTKRGDLSVQQPLSLCFWPLVSPQPPADGAKAVKDKSVLQVTNVTSLGEVRKKNKNKNKSLALQTSVWFSPQTDEGAVVDGEWLVKRCLIHSCAPLPHCASQIFQNRDNKRSEFIFIITITVMRFFGENRTTNIDIVTTMHSPNPQKERETSLLSECLIHLASAENI